MSEIVVPDKPFFDRTQAKNRMVIVDQVSFRDFNNNGDAQSFTTGWSYELESKEQPWIRRATSQGDGPSAWSKLDLGWLTSDCGLLIIHNLETEKTAGTLILGNPKEFASVPPKHECRVPPLNCEDLVIRSTVSKTRYIIKAYPK